MMAPTVASNTVAQFEFPVVSAIARPKLLTDLGTLKAVQLDAGRRGYELPLQPTLNLRIKRSR